ncbi:MAG: VOC family protein [Actinomycetes bacterium]
MARVTTYLNFARCTEEAFAFYAEVFGTQVEGEINRLGAVPPDGSQLPMSEEDKNLVMHISLPILGGHVLMGTDAPESLGFSLVFGNNQFINLEPDSYEEAHRLMMRLSEGGEVLMPLTEMFWGGWFGNLTDRFGVQWMVNFGG